MSSYDRGIATEKVCPRAGYVRLMSKLGTVVVVRTSCKTWRCKSCRDRVQRAVKAKITYGILILGSCLFITLTLEAGRELDRSDMIQRDAIFVAKAWRALLSKLRRRQSNLPMAWFRVVELTKKGQPHLHLIVGGIGDRKVTCHRPRDPVCRYDCVQHEWAALWYSITGSYIVDVKPVMGAVGASVYLTNYMKKGMMHHDELEELGFVRRWSRSRNWPDGALALRGSVEDRWERSEFISGGLGASAQAEIEAVVSEGNFLLDIVGPRELLELYAGNRKKALLSQFRSVL